MLDEKTKRRPDFLGGQPVKMADSQEWILPRPLGCFVMDDDESGIERVWNLGPEYGALVKAHSDAMGSPPGPDRTNEIVLAEFRLARWLLRRNYDLDGKEVGSLVRFGYGSADEPEAVACREAVTDLIFGMAEPPKPMPAGND